MPKRRRDVIACPPSNFPIADSKRECDGLFKVINPAAYTHLTRARCHGLLARTPRLLRQAPPGMPNGPRWSGANNDNRPGLQQERLSALEGRRREASVQGDQVDLDPRCQCFSYGAH